MERDNRSLIIRWNPKNLKRLQYLHTRKQIYSDSVFLKFWFYPTLCLMGKCMRNTVFLELQLLVKRLKVEADFENIAKNAFLFQRCKLVNLKSVHSKSSESLSLRNKVIGSNINWQVTLVIVFIKYPFLLSAGSWKQ